MMKKTAKKSQKNTYFAQSLLLLEEILSLFITHEMVDNSEQEYQPFTGIGAFIMKQNIEKTKNFQTLCFFHILSKKSLSFLNFSFMKILAYASYTEYQQVLCC